MPGLGPELCHDRGLASPHPRDCVSVTVALGVTSVIVSGLACGRCTRVDTRAPLRLRPLSPGPSADRDTRVVSVVLRVKVLRSTHNWRHGISASGPRGAGGAIVRRAASGRPVITGLPAQWQPPIHGDAAEIPRAFKLVSCTCPWPNRRPAGGVASECVLAAGGGPSAAIPRPPAGTRDGADSAEPQVGHEPFPFAPPTAPTIPLTAYKDVLTFGAAVSDRVLPCHCTVQSFSPQACKPQ